jgi:hypothetical protein
MGEKPVHMMVYNIASTCNVSGLYFQVRVLSNTELTTDCRKIERSSNVNNFRPSQVIFLASIPKRGASRSCCAR